MFALPIYIHATFLGDLLHPSKHHTGKVPSGSTYREPVSLVHMVLPAWNLSLDITLLPPLQLQLHVPCLPQRGSLGLHRHFSLLFETVNTPRKSIVRIIFVALILLVVLIAIIVLVELCL